MTIRPRFHWLWHTTFTDLLNSIRVDQAKRLLSSGKSLEEVAETVGFASVTYMNRMFNRFTGASTSEYRRIHSREDVNT